MKISARNVIEATVSKVEHGAVNSEVTVRTGHGAEIVSIITKHSAERLGLKEGKKVYAIVKSTDVLIATDD